MLQACDQLQPMAYLQIMTDMHMQAQYCSYASQKFRQSLLPLNVTQDNLFM